jgi:hypothetical protein
VKPKKKTEKTLERQAHRMVFDLRTGHLSGPLVPIYSEDCPYGELQPSELLWRYMNFRKFEDLLQKSALYFSRPDKFKDPFEGRFSPGNSTKMSIPDAEFHAAYPIAPVGKKLEAAQEIMRQCVFVSCWHRNTTESREMWEAYTSGADSVAINTSAKALYTFVPKWITKSPVKYHSDTFPRTALDHTTLFFYKPTGYRFEREFRMQLLPP